MGATIRDVAKNAGVSLGTVSKYINGGNVKEINKKKISMAIKELKYKPNSIAKGLRNSKTYTIVVLVSTLKAVFLADIINSIEEYLSPHGYSIIVCDCGDDEEVELQKAKLFVSRMVDGFVLLPSSGTGKSIDYIKEHNVPLVVIDRIIEGHEIDAVVIDNEMAGYLPTKHLLDIGHTKIGLICGYENHFTSKGRIKGYLRAHKEAGIPVDERLIINGFYTLKGGNEAFRQLWKLDEHPTSVIASNYDMTLGLIIATNNLNLKIATDLSVIGFDVLALAELTTPALSLVGQPLHAIGTSVGKLLFKRLQGDYEGFPEVIIHQPFMKLRESDHKI